MVPIQLDYSMSVDATQRLGAKQLSNAEIALRFAQMEAEVFPAPPASKTAYFGSEGKNDASSDPRKVVRMFREHPDADVAIVPSRSGFGLNDWDYRNGGDALLAEARETLGDAPFETTTVLSGGGPHHLYLMPNSTLPELRLPKSQDCGLDVFGRSKGMRRGHVMAPNSRHKSGKTLEFVTPPPWEIPPIEYPRELIEFLNDRFADLVRTDKVKQRSASMRFSVSSPEEVSSELAEYDQDERLVREIFVEQMGVANFEVGTSFRSPLPGRDDAKASAMVYRTAQDAYRFIDFSQSVYDPTTGTGGMCSLAQVWGAWVQKKPLPLPTFSRVEFSLWQRRMLLDIGWIDEPRISLPALPFDAPANVRKAWAGFAQRLRVEVAYVGKIAAVPFVPAFVSR